MRTWLLPLLLAATALSGCSDGGGDGIPGDGDFEDLPLTPTETTGIIRGVVFDAAITPLADVAVTASGPDGDTVSGTTNADGLFGFDGRAPGSWFVRAERVGYITAQQSVEVVANVAEPEIVKLLLEADPTSVPYSQAYAFVGFIECSFSLVAVGFAACSGVGNDNFLEEYILDGPPMWVQSEMVWESTQPVSDSLILVYSYAGNTTLLTNYAEARGPSPLLITVNGTQAEEVGLGAGITLMLRVFNGPIEGTTPSDPVEGDDCADRPQLGGCLTGVGMTVQQEFDVLTHVFYGYAPPEGWLFLESGSVPPPQ